MEFVLDVVDDDGGGSDGDNYDDEGELDLAGFLLSPYDAALMSVV